MNVWVNHWRARLHLARVLAIAIAIAVQGCGNHDETEVAPVSLNAKFYGYLGSSNAIRHPAAQPTVPASGEFFSENTKHFDMVPAEGAAAGVAFPGLKEGGFAVYRPAGPRPLRKSATAPVAGQVSGIPSFKSYDFPEECLSRTGDDRLVCVDEARRKEHASYHDRESLRIQLGSDSPGKVADLVLRSVQAHVGAADRAAIVGGLTDYVNDSPAHAAFDAAGQGIFDATGYALSHAVITDDSRGDVDGDGLLEPHSTLIVEVRKSLTYQRQPSPALDACVAKFSPNPVRDEYAVAIDAFVHLDHLAGFRQALAFDDPRPQTNATMVERVNAQHEAKAINHALDANLIKHILATTDSFLWSATEYMLHFQLQPGTISRYVSIIDAAGSSGDDTCVDILRSHLNAHTVFITGRDAVQSKSPGDARRTRLFFQVPEVGTVRPDAPFRTLTCLRDEAGRNVAIQDPVSGRIVPACSAPKGAASRKFTAAGACNGDTTHWANWLLVVSTPRFFTSRLYLTEMLLHDQVADHWRIQWYQDGWKATGQAVVKAAGFIINTAIKLAAGQLPVVDDFGQEAALRIGVYFVNAFLPSLIDASFRGADGGAQFEIAGMVVQIPLEVMNFALGLAKASAADPTFIAKLAGFMKGFIIGFAIDRLTSTGMQVIDSMLFEWQDYSDASHEGCFNFNE